ncbi:MAG: hypothetical protein M0021_09690 [Clostridia bacterium]|nr:hypothetical protein [Clostridia bacterium]
MAELAKHTFGFGGPAAVMVQLMLIAVVGWLLETLAQAAKNGKAAGFIRIVTIFVCIGLVVSEVAKAIGAVAGIAGLK